MGVGAPNLRERHFVLTGVDEALHAAARGGGTVVAVTGGAGAGRSSLLEYVERCDAATGFDVRRARASSLESAHEFGLVRQLFPAEDLCLPRAPGPEDLRALFEVVARAADRSPLLATVDDLQWADAASLRFLDFLARRISTISVVLLVGVHSQDEPVEPTLLHAVLANARGTTWDLRPLSAEAVADVVADRLGSPVHPAFGSACHRWTAGNPRLVEGLVTALVDARVTPSRTATGVVARLAPEVLGRAALHRITVLGDAAGRVARVAAVLGEAANLPRLARLSGMELEDAARAVGVLEKADLCSSASGVCFCDPSTAAAVYQDISPALRSIEHLRAARLLLDEGASDEQVLAQARRAPAIDDPRMVNLLRTSAQALLGEGDTAEAVALLELVLSGPCTDAVRCEVHLELGLLASAMSINESLRHLSAAVRFASTASRLEEISLLRARLLAAAGRTDEALVAIDSARASCPDGSSELSCFLDALEIQLALHVPEQRSRLDARVEQACSRSGDSLGERTARTAATSALLRGVGTPDPPGVPTFVEAGGRGTVPGCPGAGVAAAAEALLLHHLGQPSGVVRAAEALLDEAQVVGSAPWFVEGSAVRAHAYYRLGRLAEAEADAQAALSTAAAYGGQHPQATRTLIYVLLARGEVERACALGDQVTRSAGAQSRVAGALAEAAHGRALLARRDLDSGLDRLSGAGAVLDEVGIHNPELSPWRFDVAFALVEQGRRAEAEEIARPAVAAAAKVGSPYGVSQSLRLQAFLGVPADIDLLREASAVLAESGMQLKQARALADLGAALRRSGFLRDARDPLQEACALAADCAAGPLLDRARGELAAAGGRPRRIARSGTASLTPSERRIARLAASGLTNREIARDLFISQKTVETHLVAAFRKLEIGHRSELVSFSFGQP